LKTLAVCWIYRKRAFAVSGSFRQALNDLIKELHNSKKSTAQTTLTGEIILEERFYLLGFANGKDINLENTWFAQLTRQQISLLPDCLKEKSHF
jgi:hypothetical protein